jgi:hypothetical protein
MMYILRISVGGKPETYALLKAFLGAEKREKGTG